MNQIRSNNLYISSQLHRWLKWIAMMNEKSSAVKSTPDAWAEEMLRSEILIQFPNIEQLEADYWTARNKLDSETVNKLKQQTEQTKPM
jgi:hypothetical protein